MNPTDPRLVALYDLDNPDGPDHDFYRALADEADPGTIVDLGCGTGILTVTLAGPGRRVIGIDPDAGMLEYAGRRAGAETVTWVDGDSRAIGEASADLVVMTGNVAMHIVDDDWHRTLADVRAGPAPAGLLAFETRNPAARAWESRDREHSHGTRDTTDGPLTEWMDVVDVDADGTATMEFHTVFERSGEHLTATTLLAFRDRDRLVADLADAGLHVDDVWSGWERQPFDAAAPLFVVRASATGVQGNAAPGAALAGNEWTASGPVP